MKRKLRFSGGAPSSVYHFFRLSVGPSVAHHISGTEHHLIIHMRKMMIYPSVFFSFFKILIFWVVRGLTVEKITQNEKQQYIHHAPYLRNSIAYDHDFWDTCVE